MDSAELILNEDETRERDTFVERLLASTSGTFDIFTIYLGDRLGFYQTLADKGSLTSAQLATYTDTHERYVREWLEQQTVTGILQVEDEKAEARQRKYRLPAGHAEVLVERDSLNYLTPMAQMVVGAVCNLKPIPKVHFHWDPSRPGLSSFLHNIWKKKLTHDNILWYKLNIIKNYRVPTQHGYMPYHGVSFCIFSGANWRFFWN